MPANIYMKNGSIYRVDEYRDNVCNEWDKVLQGDAPLRTYDIFNHGLPLPKVTIDMREISHIEESRR